MPQWSKSAALHREWEYRTFLSLVWNTTSDREAPSRCVEWWIPTFLFASRLLPLLKHGILYIGFPSSLSSRFGPDQGRHRPHPAGNPGRRPSLDRAAWEPPAGGSHPTSIASGLDVALSDDARLSAATSGTRLRARRWREIRSLALRLGRWATAAAGGAASGRKPIKMDRRTRVTKSASSQAPHHSPVAPKRERRPSMFEKEAVSAERRPEAASPPPRRSCSVLVVARRGKDGCTSPSSVFLTLAKLNLGGAPWFRRRRPRGFCC